MQTHMTFTQMNMLRPQMYMIQAQQNRLVATNTLLMNMQMNWLLLNEETENGLSAAAEDIGKYWPLIFYSLNANLFI